MARIDEASGYLRRLQTLQTHNHSQLLDVIDELRAEGLSNLLPLPQLIVCGDQSSGKSSVLEAISGVPFPKKDNLCTRFATEVVLRRNAHIEKTKVSVSIRAGKDRSGTDKQNLENFNQDLPDVQDLPKAVQQAKDAMGLGSQGSNAFSTDVLRLEITGQNMPQLTIVDLPGLIHSENKLQTAQDVELVSQLVQSYMEQSRSIILAVISAKNDYANQIVLKRAKEADPTGQRTLGIITKPDTLHPGSESEHAYLGLARNTDVVFKLGWHVVRNLDTNEQQAEAQSRDHVENAFFHQSNWRNIDRKSLGVKELRSRLSEVLFGQITRELPRLMEEIEVYKDDTQAALDRMGRTRETESDQRLYLAELNQRVYDICKAGCDGNYDEGFFRETDGSMQPIEIRRIRAAIQNQSIAFRRKLESNGCRWKDAETSNAEEGRITRDEAIDRVVDLLKRSRGRELPGTFNPLLISELFHEYSSPWEDMSRRYLSEVWQTASRFLEQVLRHLTEDSVFEAYMRLIINPALDQILLTATKALDVLFQERQRHAMTYDNSFTENVVREQQRMRREDLEERLTEVFATQKLTIGKAQIPMLLGLLTKEPELDMDRQAAIEIYEKMQAYYRVALKRLADNVPIHVVESVIIQQLQTVVKPLHVWKMDKSQVEEIAGESYEAKEHRNQLSDKLAILTKGELLCKRYVVQVESTPTHSVLSEKGVLAEAHSHAEDDSGSESDNDEDEDEDDAAEVRPAQVEPESANYSGEEENGDEDRVIPGWANWSKKDKKKARAQMEFAD